MKINKVLGIDPGLDRTGWAIVESSPTCLSLVSAGLIHTDKDLPFQQRLLQVYQEIEKVINDFEPKESALEKMYFLKRADTMNQTLQTRGVIMLALAQKGLDITEYPAKRVKLTISGNGSADKKQMQRMVQLTLKLKEQLNPDDVADAAAIAICHLKTGPLQNEIKIKQAFMQKLILARAEQIKNKK